MRHTEDRFDITGYVTTFDFCDKSEMRRLYGVLKEAWKWGRGVTITTKATTNEHQELTPGCGD